MPLSKPEIVAIALFQLRGASKSVDTETIAIEADRIAPGVFVWSNYPDRIDKELVRHALRHARREQGLVEGSHDKGGWILTPKGVALAEKADAATVDGAGKKVGQQAGDREKARLLGSEAFSAFTLDGTSGVTDEAANSFFRLTPYMRVEARERKILRIENLFADGELSDAVAAIAAVARKES